MKTIIESRLADLASGGNLRKIPADSYGSGLVDLSSNDYLGFAEDQNLKEEFFERYFDVADSSLAMSASASRLLASRQKVALELEETLATAYGKQALLFNSGYHANVGMISALGAIKNCYILADRLVHASIIDGIRLSGARFARFRHNDYEHLAELAAKACADGCKVLIVAESVYSMDGDQADIRALAEIRNNCPGAMLYVDEAHAVGVEGPAGLGLSAGLHEKAFLPDIIVGTFGKALASCGAYAVVEESVKRYMVNTARSFIFSTSLPPVNLKWSEFIFKKSLEADSRRESLKANAKVLSSILRPFGGSSEGHIQPLILGNPNRAVEASAKLREAGYEVLPIRVPTVPPGTDRLRFSLSAALTPDQLQPLKNILLNVIPNGK